MTGAAIDFETLRASAKQAAASGDRGGAARAWQALLEARPGDPEAANALGNIAMGGGDAANARRWFEQAVAGDPQQPALLFNLAAACKNSGDLPAALAALDRALALDPYFVQAVFQKAVVLQDGGSDRYAARIFDEFLRMVPGDVAQDPRFAPAIERARAAVEADQGSLGDDIDALGQAPSARVAAGLDALTGRKPVYRSEPTFLTVPQLPAIPFFPRETTPWLADLEAQWTVIRDEAAALLAADRRAEFAPYVANPAGTPLNQWRELDHSNAWGALFVWKHGAKGSAFGTLLPRTTEILGTMPLLRIPGRGPNAFLSRLEAKTRIPAHTGVTNARVTVHLPLIVPEGCGFRVGGDTREWMPGTAWVFDDTIEHEAWNDSDEERVILIFDIWNPLLEADERVHLTRALAVWDRHYGGAEANAEF